MQVFSRLGSTVYTILKTKVKKAMIDTYPSISFSDEPSDKDPSFPNVFFQQLQPVETGQDLERRKINGVLDTVQITVTTNTSKSDANKVVWACVDALKDIMYDVVGMPMYELRTRENSKVHTYNIRARRNIAENDIL